MAKALEGKGLFNLTDAGNSHSLMEAGAEICKQELMQRRYVHVNVSCKSQERMTDALELELLVIVTHLRCLLGTELSSTGKGSMHSESLSHLSSSYRYNFNSGERNTASI